MINLAKHLWPLASVDEALAELARRYGLAAKPVELHALPADWADDRQKFSRWLETTAHVLGLEAEPSFTNYTEIDKLLDCAGPALLRVSVDHKNYLLVLLGRRRGKMAMLGPDRSVHHAPLAEIRALICAPMEAPLLPEIEQLLGAAGVAENHKTKTRQAILRERLSDAWIAGCWLIRLPLTQSLWQHARAAKLPGRFALFLVSYLVFYLLWIVSWWLVGKGALQGRIDLGWMQAWLLILLTLVPLQMLSKWLEGVAATGVGVLLKQKLLHGVLQLNPDEIRHQGAGQLFSRVAAAEILESFSLNGGFLGMLGLIELSLAAVVLAQGPAGATYLLLMIAWLALTAVLSWRFLRTRVRWANSFMRLSHDLVERMVGHRTRIVQESRERWHEAEDQELENYFAHTKTMDQTGVMPISFASRGWVIVGLAALAPSFIAGQISPALLAIGLGGILLAYRAFHKIAESLAYFTGALVAWRQITALLQAASHSGAKQTFAALYSTNGEPRRDREMLVNAKDLFFRYRENSKPVLEGYNLQINRGERLLLQGPSGGGKSTLASILTGLRQPHSGLLLLNGLDWQTLGSEGWRRRIVSAPQFHENHVLTGTFAFNLLMGRRWPPGPEDLQEAEALCYELGLGELLQRMPAGLVQMVGETGWQLSHGERSRLYMARALLQNAELIILDESFAALDPENLQKAVQCAINRAATLMVIAHP
jgi:ATP-binding cassette subfamily B protein